MAYGDFVTKTMPQDYKASTADFFYEQPFSSGTYTLSGAVMRYRTGNAINAFIRGSDSCRKIRNLAAAT